MKRVGALLGSWLTLALVAAAQDVAPPPATPYTLHAYANRLQVATLLLDAAGNNLANVTARQVELSLDGGPRFHPTMVRPAGNDPLHLAVLIEADGDQRDLVAAAVRALPPLLAAQLTPADRATFYAVDCDMLRSNVSVSPDPEHFQSALNDLLTSRLLRSAEGRHCQSRVELWTAIAAAMNELGQAPGRRVLLVISQGVDNRSRLQPPQLARLASDQSIAIFALRGAMENALHDITRRARPITDDFNGATRDGLEFLASLNGGLVFDEMPEQVPATLDRFLHLLRTRYVLEFPPPDHIAVGRHSILASDDKAVLVRGTGVSAVLPDDALRNDPSTVPSAPSPTLVGKAQPRH